MVGGRYLTAEDGLLRVVVIPMTGPSPSDQEENIIGGLVGGSIRGLGLGGFTEVKVGAGMPVRAGKSIATPEPETTELLNRLIESHPTER